MKKLLKPTRSPYPLFKYDLKMKLATLFILAALFTMHANDSYGQGTKLTLNLDNVTVGRLINEIENTSEFQFVYMLEDVNLQRIVSVNAKQEKIGGILKNIFQNTNTTFNIQKKRIYLVRRRKKDNPDSLDESKSPLQQQNVVSGIITDINGQPLPGANIVEKGTTNGTQTNFDGNFSIEVGDNAVLVVSYIGFATKEVNVGGQSSISISLIEDAAGLEEVVVVGYGTKKKVDLTGAVSVVDVESMARQSTPLVTSQLQGQASGVTVSSSGQPGENPQVRIRGINTFGNNNPLYVVDGVPSQDISNINPNNITSLQVLKDAASASIYGARAANGVIIITTRKGTGSKPTFSYNSYTGIQHVKGGNVYNLLSPQEQADLRWKTFENSNPGEPINDPQYGSGPEPILPDYILPAGASQGEVDESSYYLDPYYTDPNALEGFNQIIRANKQGTNWFQEIFKTAVITSHDLSVSRGGDKGNLMFSLNYINQEGTLINTFFKRYTARVNSQSNITEDFRIGENISVSFSEQNPLSVSAQNPISYAYRTEPIIPIYDIMGNYAGTQAPNLGNSWNSVALLDRNRDNLARTSRIFGNIFAEFDFLDAFTVRSSFGGNYTNRNSSIFQYPTYEKQSNITTNQLTKEASYNYNWTWTNTLQYEKNFNDIHDLSLLVGAEAYQNRYEEMISVAQGFYSFNPNYVSLDTGSGIQTNSGYQTEDALFSVFGRLEYTYRDTYLVGGTIRRDATSRFTNPRHGWFPSLSAGWRISQENFMNGVDWISELKLRGGYGILGNQNNVDPANAFTTYGSSRISSYYDINGTNNSTVEGFERLRIGNPNASWEKNINFNIGFDATLFNNNLQITADYYNKKVVDLLFNPELSGTAGISTVPYVNIAEMSNRGFDMSSSLFLDVTSDLKLNSTLTFTTYSNEIKNVSDGVSYFDQEPLRFGIPMVRNMMGHSIGQFYGYKIEGFWNDQQEVDEANQLARNVTGDSTVEYQTAIGVGRFRYADVNGDGIITGDDRTFLGNPNPKFTAGLNIELDYKNFDMSMFLYGSYGNDIWNQVKWWHDFYSSFNGVKSYTALYDSWTPTNNNASAPIQETVSTFSTASVPNSYYVEDGSYMRLKTLQIGYKVPTNVVNNLRIYFQTTNLFTITGYSGVDPELSARSATVYGIDEEAYPSAKQYILGVNITL